MTKLLPEELDVIEAARDYIEAIEASQYGPMTRQIKKAQAALHRAVAALDNQCDGRWTRGDE